MRGQIDSVFYEQDPELYKEVAASQQAYNSIATSYQGHIDELMHTLTAHTAHTRSTTQDFVYTVASWFVDRRCQNGGPPAFAVRLDGRVHATHRQPILLPTQNAIGPKLYEANANWNQTARSLGAYGLYLSEIMCTFSALRPLQPHEYTLQPLDQTHFVPASNKNLPGYTVDSAQQTATVLSKLPTHNQIIKRAYDTFIISHGTSLFSQDLKDEFAQVVQQDAADPYGPIDNQQQYIEKTKTRNPDEVRSAIGKLAESLYHAGDQLISADLLDRMVTTNVKELAQLALLNRTSYFRQTVKQPGLPLLSHRLSWVIKMKEDLISSLRDNLHNDSSGFGQHIQQELHRLAQTTQNAARLCMQLRSPDLLCTPVPGWEVRAR
ncbi:MAG TPA: hypothetical protein VF733_05865 [Candidatus Saccharimonadales bacterium]